MPRRAPTREEFPLREANLHGHRVGYRMAGDGPLVVLIHGITSTSEVWADVMAGLAERYTVVAPDLLGHGRSAKPRGDYSLGAYASGGRDLLGLLGFESGTVVGHSLGGGIALQFAYQFPEYCERLALISSGGLGKEVHPLLRAAALPGAEFVLPLITRDWAIATGSAAGAFLDRIGLQTGPDIVEAARGYASLADRGAREAFLHTLRAVIDLNGQRVSATDRLYLAERMPTLLIWGTDDPIIPIEHGRAAVKRIPASRLVEIPGSGHWPQLDAPRRLVTELIEFIETTEPYVFDLDHMRDMLKRGPQGAAATTEVTAS
jgi:pimeloyl-ACP methyl ester carboxylesterase